ncbi:aspartate-alanine antiporter-like transporter [Streptomyces microflavus]|uniref:aspartate-alanine antiporter-like transporter n=1 Tax=Streptomyces microflavus TaxID=1919 RepID=UPI00382393BB
MWQFFADNPWVTVFAVIALGSLLGLVRFGPVRLGAAGVLFVGLFVGALDEDIAAAVPAGVSALGLALYVYTVGLESGPFSLFGLKLVAVLAIGAVVSYSLLVLVAKGLGQSRERTMGLLSGYVGNPAIVAYANSRASDSRINNGYSTLFALAILVKIVCIQLIVGL